MSMTSKRTLAALSVGGVVSGIAFTIYLTQTIFAPIIEEAYWVPENGFIGIIAWLVLYVILALLVAPASFHKFVSGVLFGFWGGWVIAFVGAFLGSILPFWLTQKYLYQRVERKLENRPVLSAIKKAVSEDGLTCVFLTRTSVVIP